MGGLVNTDFQTLVFSSEDVLLAAEWARAERLFNEQRARVLAHFGPEYPPPFFAEIGLEERIGWWERARQSPGLGLTTGPGSTGSR